MAIVISGTTGIDAGSLPVANTGKISAGSGLPAILNTAGVDRVTVDTAGNVGIGTSSPTTKMHIVDGDLRVESSSASPTIQLTDTGVANSYIYMPNGSNALAYNVGGAERMRINSSGIVTMPYQPAFTVRSTGYNNTYNINPVLFDIILLNTGNNYNSSTGRFTAPVSGNYQINVYNNMLNPNTADTLLHKNGSAYAGVEHDDANTTGRWDGRGFSIVVPMVAGDYLTVTISGASSISTAVEGREWNAFSGYLIG